MKTSIKLIGILLSCYFILVTAPAASYDNFAWPQGKRAAISLTFDDARESQLDVAIPILQRYGVKATFYVLPNKVKSRLEDWKKTVAADHEIGNHTINHSCSGNFPWSSQNALENCTLDHISHEIDVASASIETMLNIKPVSFAYPCGQTFVGRGVDTKSYVPLIAKHFFTGRTYPDQVTNDPAFCDFSKLTGIKSDDLSWEEVKTLVDDAISRASWLILVSHGVGSKDPQTMSADVLSTLLEYAKSPENGIWIAPVNKIASHIAASRSEDLQPKSEQQGWNLGLSTQYINVGKILGVGLLSFFCGIFFVYVFPTKMLKLLLFSGSAILVFISIMSIRDGYIGPKGLMPIFSTLGFCLGFASSIVPNKTNKKSKT